MCINCVYIIAAKIFVSKLHFAAFEFLKWKKKKKFTIGYDSPI